MRWSACAPNCAFAEPLKSRTHPKLAPYGQELEAPIHGRVTPHSAGKVSGVILTRMKIKQKTTFFNFFREGKFRMNKANGPVGRIKIGLGIALVGALTGCVGFVDGGGYGGDVVVPGPDVYLFGGGYDRGRDVHGYSQRGFASRAVARPAMSSAAHSGGGGHGGKR